MPTAIDLHMMATWPVAPDADELHGLACALFEGDGEAYLGQRKPFRRLPLRQPGQAPPPRPAFPAHLAGLAAGRGR